MQIKKVEFGFEVIGGMDVKSKSFARYYIEWYTTDRSVPIKQSVYDNEWGLKQLNGYFGFKGKLDIDFFSDGTIDVCRGAIPQLVGREAKIMTTKNNYSFIKVI